MRFFDFDIFIMEIQVKTLYALGAFEEELKLIQDFCRFEKIDCEVIYDFKNPIHQKHFSKYSPCAIINDVACYGFWQFLRRFEIVKASTNEVV